MARFVQKRYEKSSSAESSAQADPVPAAVVNFRQVRDCVKATGKLAKTDALDAQVLTHFAAAIQPKVWEIADEESLRSPELVAR